MNESLPGITHTIRAAAITLTALFVAATGGAYCAGKKSVDTSELEAQVRKAKDSVHALERDRALYVGQAAALRVVAVQAKIDRVAALAHSDSLERAAERHRTFRLRIVDSAHVATTASDTDHVEKVETVPVAVVVQLQLDSAALEAHDISEAKLVRENNALTLENLKLWQAVGADSSAMRQQATVIDGLTKLKTPSRFGFKAGIAAAVAVLAAVHFLLGARL